MWRSPRPILVFWLLFPLLRISFGIMALLLAVEAINLGEVYFLFLGGDVDARRGWVLALFPSTQRASVVVLFRLDGRSLLSRRWLFPIRCVSRGRVGGLILSTGVLLLLFSWLVPLETSWVHVAGTGGGLQQRLCLCIDGFLDGFFPGV